MNGVRSDTGVAACKISRRIADGNRTIAAESRSPCRSGYRRPATEVPSAAGEPCPAAARAAEMRPTAAKAPGARATEMAAAAVPATADVSTAVASATTPTASAASSSSIDRARKRYRKNNHGQDFEFRHDNLLKPPALVTAMKRHDWDHLTPERLNNA
jgi:hypothetical protein